jgi:hypothetical protein
MDPRDYGSCLGSNDRRIRLANFGAPVTRRIPSFSSIDNAFQRLNAPTPWGLSEPA